MLALLVAPRVATDWERGHWLAVALAVAGLVLLGVSLAGGIARRSRADAGRACRLAGVSALLALVAAVAPVPIAAGAGLASQAGLLYAAGDVATKPVAYGGAWLLLVPVLVDRRTAPRSSRSNSASSASARSRPAGMASLLTNAVPIAAGVVLFHERAACRGGIGALRWSYVVVACVRGRRQLLARPEQGARTPCRCRSATRRHQPDDARSDLFHQGARRKNSCSWGLTARPTSARGASSRSRASTGSTFRRS